MVFEVKATHRETSTGFAACEVHPDVFVDEWGRVFATAESLVEDAGTVAIQEIGPEDDDQVFVVDDDAIELTVAWIEVLSGRQAERLLEQRVERRWAASSGAVPRIRPDIDWASPRGEGRTVVFDVRASHRLPSGGGLACEIYPDVFVTARSRGVLSRLAGMAMQQPATSSMPCPITRRSGSASTVSNTRPAGWGPSRDLRMTSGASTTEAEGHSTDYRSGRWALRARRVVGWPREQRPGGGLGGSRRRAVCGIGLEG